MKTQFNFVSYWLYLTVRKCSKPYLWTLGRDPMWHPSVCMDFIRLGSVTSNRKNGLTGEQLAVCADARSISTGLSRMFSILTEGCHMSYSREFVGTVYYTYGQSNTTLVSNAGCQMCFHSLPPEVLWLLMVPVGIPWVDDYQCYKILATSYVCKHWSYNYTHHTTKLLGGILVSLHPSVRPSVRLSVRPF